jgi:prepilin-type N-terminal cleavage/methylation domain-containing protein
MKTITHSPQSQREAFTLIELLVVIAVIGILAALIFPVIGVIKDKEKIGVAKSELAQVESALNAYKARFGTYPPDNPASPLINPLYYELEGTTMTNVGGVVSFTTKDGGSTVTAPDLTTAFGVSGLVNVSRGSGDDAVKAETFLINLRPNQIGQLTATASKPLVLVSTVGWDNDNPGQQIISTTASRQTPIQYNSSHPANNPTSYDLWIDILIRGKTNRICNWGTGKQIL